VGRAPSFETIKKSAQKKGEGWIYFSSITRKEKPFKGKSLCQECKLNQKFWKNKGLGGGGGGEKKGTEDRKKARRVLVGGRIPGCE